MSGDGDKFRVREGRKIVNLPDEGAAVHVGHRQVDEHEIGLKDARNF